MSIYLDNSATTMVYPEIVSAIEDVYINNYGNPSSMHKLGFKAEQLVKDSLSKIAKTLHADPGEIIITSGGTESNNTAIFGAVGAKKRQGRHIITTSVEHPSVGNVMIYLESLGYEITFLPVDKNGVVSPDDIRNALRPDTVLVSVMMVNNEIGSRMPVEDIGLMLKKEAPNVLFHVDAVQGYGKYNIKPAKCGIDLMSVSGHKIHGPKGIGFLYIRDGVKINQLLFGGGQQKDMRSGTENVPGIVGLGLACEKTYKELDEINIRLYEYKTLLQEELSRLDGVIINGPLGNCGSPHIVSASFSGIKSEVLLHALEEKGIYVSSGSACASNHPGISSVLTAIEVPSEYINGTIRISMSSFNTKEDIITTIDAIKELVPILRKFIRR